MVIRLISGRVADKSSRVCTSARSTGQTEGRNRDLPRTSQRWAQEVSPTLTSSQRSAITWRACVRFAGFNRTPEQLRQRFPASTKTRELTSRKWDRAATCKVLTASRRRQDNPACSSATQCPHLRSPTATRDAGVTWKTRVLARTRCCLLLVTVLTHWEGFSIRRRRSRAKPRWVRHWNKIIFGVFTIFFSIFLHTTQKWNRFETTYKRAFSPELGQRRPVRRF